jgi:DNA-binding CsgD family transcriptional regulator/pimeloyl-ACP methyl ester carboxylesterase
METTTSASNESKVHDLGTREVVKRIKPEFDNPNEYDELVDAWRDLCDRCQRESNDDLKFAEIEKAAIVALSAAPKEQLAGHVGQDISRMLNSFDYPTFLVTSMGHISACNLCAWKEFNLEVCDSIDQLPFRIDGLEKISELISQEIHKESSAHDSSLLLKRTHPDKGQQHATIAITISFGQIPTALVFVITTQWKPRSVDLLKQQFGLTRAEAEVLISFVDGYSPQDIAKQRNRSQQTVRTQFQSIREKLGVKNQTDLLRTTLSVSDFNRDIGRITSAVEHPHRRKSENVRAGGRVVEATLMGDFAGDPIVSISAVSHYTFNAEFEKMLYEARLLLISVCPPGYGTTDLSTTESSWIDQAGDDMVAVLDQLDISRCVMLITFTNAPMSYRIARMYPSRFSHIVQLNTCGPASFDQASQDRSPWISGIVRACTGNSAIVGILLRGYIKSWAAIGARQFMRLQMSSNPVDARYALLPENIAEAQHALETATWRGIDGALQEHLLVFEDWTTDIDAVQVQMTFIHGRENKLFTIDSIRKLAELFSDKVNLVEIENAGFTAAQSHPEKVIGVLRLVVDSHAAKTHDNLL